MQPDIASETIMPSTEKLHVEKIDDSQTEIGEISEGFTHTAGSLFVEFKNIVDNNPGVDLGEEQAEMDDLNGHMDILTERAEVDEGMSENTSSVGGAESADVATRMQYKSKNLALIHNLIGSRVITSEPSDDPKWKNHIRNFSVDTDAATAILEKSDTEEAFIATTDQEKQTLDIEVKQSFPEVLHAFSEAGVLPDALANQLSRLLKPDNVLVGDFDFHQFYYLQDSFPEKSGETPVLRFGAGQLKYMETRLTEALSAAGVTLDQGQIHSISVRWGLSHEIGHAVDRAMMLGITEERLKADAGLEDWKEAVKVSDDMRGEVESIIAPDKDITSIFASMDNSEELHTGNLVAERIAGGFEYIGLRMALKDVGLDDNQQGLIIDYFNKNNNGELEEKRNFIDYLGKNGLSVDNLGSAFYDIKNSLKDSERADLAEKVPSFRIDSLGYTRPLSENQTRAYVNKYSHPV